MYKKPAIVVLTRDPALRVLKEVLAGIEEEGVLFEVTGSTEPSCEELALEGAAMSSLGVGIGIFEGVVCVQVSKMPPGNMLFRGSLKKGSKMRNIGANAARYIKGIPFKELG
jgi:hypothetical protein